ncbi:MAG TPA: L-rhamnose/proton symporter RhaT [Prevotellaceae bacterium]|nr:L-rhamnose/proton symporter RhaT [Prevotellaceae bacterium]
MNIVIGLIIIAFGSFCQSSSYVPIKKVREWSWESFWLVQGMFAWIVFPLLGALLAVPQGSSLSEILGADSSAALKAMGFGALWGVGGLTFGLSMRYLGVALGQSLSLGLCAAVGTLLPALVSHEDLFHGGGLILLLGVCLTIAGIAVIGYAGALRSRQMSEEDRRKAIKDFALTKGLLIAVLAGVMSACFSLGLEAGKTLQVSGMKPLFATLPATLMVTLGGFVTNAAYCLWKNFRNRTFSDYADTKALGNNLLFCALAGLLWYSQFFGLSLAKGYLAASPTLMTLSFCILMALNVTFSNAWGIILKEWKGCSPRTIAVLVLGLAVLIVSCFLPQLI